MNPHLYLIHGWAANARIFKPLLPLLPDTWTAVPYDLPGHGSRSGGAAFETEAFSVEQAADGLLDSLAAPAHLFGWSLGALVALHAAERQPEKVKSLTLCAAFAKLRAAPDYPQGVRQNMFERMIGLFRQDYGKYMRQFLELQLMHHPEGRGIVESVLPDIAAHGTPQALQSALDAVESADARPLLERVRCPVLLIYGDKDTITPLRMGEYLAERLPNAQLQVIHKAAHAPFLSHAPEVAALLRDFVGSV